MFPCFSTLSMFVDSTRNINSSKQVGSRCFHALSADIGVNIGIFLGQLSPLTSRNSLKFTNALLEATKRVTLGTNTPDACLGSFIKQVASS